MSKKYADLKVYLNDICCDMLMRRTKGLIFGNLDKFNLVSDYIPSPTERDIEDVAITSLHTEAGQNDEVFIHCNAYAEEIFSGFAYGRRRNDVDSDTKRIWLAVKFKAKFTDKFENMRIVDIRPIDEKDAFVSNKCSTKSFIPYISADSLDYHATEFLKKYCPQALKTPMPLPIEDVVKAMGLRVKIGSLKGGAFGRCYFADKEIKKKDGSKGIIKKGTILCDDDAFFLSGIGSMNNTIIHECVHWEYHRRFFALMRLLDPSLSAIVCTTLEEDVKGSKKNTEDFRWMEWQANALAPRILMPADMMKLKYEQVKSEVVAGGETDLREIYKQTINKLADFFQVTVTSVKIRLLELGYNYLKGIHDYVDNTPTKPYLYNAKDIKPHQIFSAGLYDVVASGTVNSDLRNCLQAKTIVYANGFFVINNKKYTYKDPLTGKQELTDYALEHMDECCLIFDAEPKAKRTFDDRYYSMCFLCRSQASQDAYTRTVKQNDFNNRQLRRSIEICDVLEENREALEIVRQLVGDFKDMLKVLMEKYGYSNREMKKQTGIDDHKIAAFLDGTKEPAKSEVIAIVAGMQLHPVVSEHLISKSGVNLITTSEKDAMYHFLINQCYEEGLDSWNERLREAGMMDWQLP
ncbi:MAG: hypothetical protein IJB34_01330 [Clostridia bacterium]|nr:hypothetical protein [Clostridia bacterium]